MGIFQAFARETFGSHPVARFCVFTPRLVIRRCLCTSCWQNSRKCDALCPQCLQERGLRLRLSCQLLVAPSVYFRESCSQTRAAGSLFHVGKGVEAPELASFLSQNGIIEKYLQITSGDVKDFREGAILQAMETTWQSPFVFFLKLQLTFFHFTDDIPVHLLFFPRGLSPTPSPPSNLCSVSK